MGGRVLYVAAVFLLCSSVVFATPPTNVTVDYDGKGNVHVTARHPTDRMERYYVRRVEIYKNGVMDKTMTYPRQTAAWGIDEFIPYTAGPGDHIRVKLYSSEGGSGEAEMVIPTPPSSTEPPVVTSPPTAPPASSAPATSVY